MIKRDTPFHLRLMCSAAVVAIVAGGAAHAQDIGHIHIEPQPLVSALNEFGAKTGQPVISTPELTASKLSPGVKDADDPAVALAQLLDGTGLSYRCSGDTYLIVPSPESGPAPKRCVAAGAGGSDGADGTVQALVVTAQKREENIQDVPIAMSAFTQEDLTRSQVAGGPDLITQVPNMTFTKTNFSSYSIQLRGIGTQAISATTDPAVAVAFNNTPFIRNRFFEQEFYDLQRVEVLRGPQGTLYGRNATAGVVNIISAKPKFRYEAKLSADVGNFSSSRLEGMVNIPLVEEKVALRFAGAWTKRDGYATNELSGAQIDGRDLWSTRVSLRVAPTDRLDVNLIWEHFQENDDRLRSGKQLCKKDLVLEVAGFTESGGVPLFMNPGLANFGQGGPGGEGGFAGAQARFSQGCTRHSLYAQDTYQRPNGYMLPYYLPLSAIGLPTALNDPYVTVVDPTDSAAIMATNDQPANLRIIQSTTDPKYRAGDDLGELQIRFDLTDTLTLASETAYARDMVYSLQDFNRFNTAPGAWDTAFEDVTPDGLVTRGILTPDGYFCDPQLGCSDRLVAVDVSTARATQFSEELRLSSNFEGPFNFSLGANYLRGDSEDKYYVFINSLSLAAARKLGEVAGQAATTPYIPGVTDNSDCLVSGFALGNPSGIFPVTGCVYIDPNPIGSVNDQGHNYFLSKNPYKLISYAVFGEAYYQLADNLKATAGLRWTVDKKEAPRVPTWLLAAGYTGYPVAEVLQQEWREPTGRLALDWKPNLSFTDETMVYASYAHGYKAGGANPPGYVRAFYQDRAVAKANTAASATRPLTFDPEFVNAFELGAKNTLADGRITLNLASFYYDYKDYQISEIVDRSAFNRNFDATVWGVELEADWRPLENLRLSFKGGYEKTRVADGEQAIDLMDRTAGDPAWTLLRPFPTFASSCILPTWLFVGNADGNPGINDLGSLAGGGAGGCEIAYEQGLDPGAGAAGHSGVINYTQWSTNPADYAGFEWPGGVVTDRTYPGWDPATAPNHGEGIAKPLGGNELPNAPHWTATVTGDYSLPLANDWLMTLHSDVHWQSQSWWRVFNDSTYDKLHPYFTMNLAAIFTNEGAGWNIMAYIKNVTDETAITGAFLNSDDTGLTTNVFLTEPRLYGLRVTKAWTGGPMLGWVHAQHGGPYPFTLEIGGQVQRHHALNQNYEPPFGDEFAGDLNIFDDAQDADLDWGDGREFKLTWRSQGAWAVGASIRSNRTNGSTDTRVQQLVEGCILDDPSTCEVLSQDPNFGDFYYYSLPNNAVARVSDREKQQLVDFEVSRELSATPLTSRVRFGLRHATIESSTHGLISGVPDWFVPVNFAVVGGSITHTVYDAVFDAKRKFKGLGPVAFFDLSYPLMDMKDAGQVNVDGSISGGALFGDRSATFGASGNSRAYEENIFQYINIVPKSQPTRASFVLPTQKRSSETMVPLAAISLGLSYEVDRFSIGTGYRWERYYNVLDAGLTEEKDADRTIDGPYLTLAIGFGG